VCIYFLKKLETEVICTKLDHLKTRSAAMTEPKLEKLEKLSCCVRWCDEPEAATPATRHEPNASK
jgi:hypothetical protein